MIELRTYALVIIGILSASLVVINPSSAHPEESQDFKNQHTGVDFPIGYIDLDAGEDSVRVYYPAMDEGED